MKFCQGVDVLIAPIQEVFPRISYNLNSFTNFHLFKPEQTYNRISHTLKHHRPIEEHLRHVNKQKQCQNDCQNKYRMKMTDLKLSPVALQFRDQDLFKRTLGLRGRI